MNLIEAISTARWHILSTFVEFGFSPRRLISEFTEDQLYHLYKMKRDKSAATPAPGQIPDGGCASRQHPATQRRGEFPYDVRYLSAQQASEMVALSSCIKAARQKRGQPLRERERIWLWDEERRAACTSADLVARRCSMDDYLWHIYHSYRSRGMVLTLDACRHILQTKLHIAPLYSKKLVGSGNAHDGKTYFSPAAAPKSLKTEECPEAMRTFNAIFARLRERIETQI